MTKTRTGGLLGTALALALMSATGIGCGDVERFDGDGHTTALTGLVVDWANVPVVGADVLLVIGDEPVTETVTTDSQGYYYLPGVPGERVIDSYLNGDEVTLLIQSPAEDLAPFGTSEGDRIHLTPLTLNEFVSDISLLAAVEEVELRTGNVPLQASGFEITDELIADGGELTWSFEDSPIGGPLEVTLIIAPGSIQLTGHEPQREITLTPIERDVAPMKIPAAGTGVIWTIQPRDVVFDPPAKIRVVGSRMGLLGMTEAEVGSRFDVFGASLESGWSRFGPVEVKSFDPATRAVTLESTEGIISRGAWGHVFAGTNTDAGVLISCKDRDSGAYIPCAVKDDNWDTDGDGVEDQVGWVSLYQWDYNNQHRDRFYYTDRESICSGCGSHPDSMLAFGLNLCKDDPTCDPNGSAPVAGVKNIWLMAVRLDCLGLGANDGLTLDERDAVIYNEFGDTAAWWEDLDPFAAVAEVEFNATYRGFSYSANFSLPPCP